MAKKPTPKEPETESVQDQGTQKDSNAGVRKDILQHGFSGLHELEATLSAAMEKHIEPIKRAITKDRKKMCADLNMKWADLKPLFELEKRALAAGDMEDSDEGDDVITNMQEAWNYLRKGEVLNFLDVLDKELVKQPDYMAGESTGDGFEDDKSGPEKMQAAEAAETGNGASAPA